MPADILGELSSQLLPTADLSNVRHLVVVPDGPLYLLPFSILPVPESLVGDPLVESVDVSYLPSTAVLAPTPGPRAAPGNRLAILADPVFSQDDSRLKQASECPVAAISDSPLDGVLTRSVARNHLMLYPRLPGTREEARIIREAAIGAEVFVALDTEANRDLLLSGQLDHFDVIHFATHGILDANEPALSGLVLSGVNDAGVPRLRFLRSQDVASLRLDAALIVLSGCEAGLGRVVDGEGVVGLSQASFEAGAKQVASSLWRVPDRATATLMEYFYNEIYRNGAAPVTALRRAKQAMRESRRWQNPYYWAGFVLQGDWRQSP